MYGTQHGACGYWRRNIIWNVWNQKLVCGKFFQSSEMQNCEQKIWFLLMPNKNRSSLLLRKYTQWCSTYNYKCTVHFFSFLMGNIWNKCIRIPGSTGETQSSPTSRLQQPQQLNYKWNSPAVCSNLTANLTANDITKKKLRSSKGLLWTIYVLF